MLRCGSAIREVTRLVVDRPALRAASPLRGRTPPDGARSPRAADPARPRRRLRSRATTAATRWPAKRITGSSTIVSSGIVGRELVPARWRTASAGRPQVGEDRQRRPAAAKAALASIPTDAGRGMRGAQDLHVKQVRDGDIHRVAHAARDDAGTRRGRQAAAGRLPRRRRSRHAIARRSHPRWRGSRCNGTGCPSGPPAGP